MLVDRTVVIIGWNDYNKCEVPPHVQGKVIRLAFCGNHSSVLLTDRNVVMFGRNHENQCNFS